MADINRRVGHQGLAPKTYGLLQFELKESRHEKLVTYYLIAGCRKQPGHPICVEKNSHVLRLMLTNSRNEWPTSFFFFLSSLSFSCARISCESRITEIGVRLTDTKGIVEPETAHESRLIAVNVTLFCNVAMFFFLLAHSLNQMAVKSLNRDQISFPNHKMYPLS